MQTDLQDARTRSVLMAGKKKKSPQVVGRVLGPETAKNHKRRLSEGFYDRYLSGDHVLDIGYLGGSPNAQPVTDKAIGIELDYPGYDGVHLPFSDGSQDTVFASHCLEHIRDYRAVLRDWFRVIRVGGYIAIAVPSRYLYERRSELPSRFNGTHLRFYTPTSLLAEIDSALPEGEFRIRSLRDIDEGFDYAVPPETHARGSYEIELVLQKIAAPDYLGEIRSAPPRALAKFVAEQCVAAIELGPDQKTEYGAIIQVLSRIKMPHYVAVLDVIYELIGSPLDPRGDALLRRVFVDAGALGNIDPAVYRNRYKDLSGMDDEDILKHWRNHGYFEFRVGE